MDLHEANTDDEPTEGEELLSAFQTPQHSANSEFDQIYLITASHGSLDIFHDPIGSAGSTSCISSNCINNSSTLRRKRLRAESRPLLETSPKSSRSKFSPKLRKCSLCSATHKCTSPSNPNTPVNKSQTYSATQNILPTSQEAESSGLNSRMELKNFSKDTVDETWKKNYVPCAELTHLPEEVEVKVEQPPRCKIPPDEMRIPKCRLSSIRKEFSSSNFGVSHRTPSLFATSTWQNPAKVSCLFMMYRIFWAIYFPLWVGWSIAGFNGYGSPLNMKGYYLLFATNWSMIVISADAILQAFNAVVHAKNSTNYDNCAFKTMPSRYKISWILSNISAIHVFILIVYWTVINRKDPTPVNAISINTHIVPGMYIILDTFISATPKRILHACYPMLYMTLYGLFTIIYFLCGGLDHKGRVAIYPILDWNKTAQTFLSCAMLVFVLIPLLQLFIFTLFKLRCELVRKVYGRRESPSDETNIQSS